MLPSLDTARQAPSAALATYAHLLSTVAMTTRVYTSKAAANASVARA